MQKEKVDIDGVKSYPNYQCNQRECNTRITIDEDYEI